MKHKTKIKLLKIKIELSVTKKKGGGVMIKKKKIEQNIYKKKN